MSKIFDWQLVFTEIPLLLKYLPVTIQLTLIALIIGWVAGLFIAIVKIHRIPVLQQLCTSYYRSAVLNVLWNSHFLKILQFL